MRGGSFENWRKCGVKVRCRDLTQVLKRTQGRAVWGREDSGRNERGKVTEHQRFQLLSVLLCCLLVFCLELFSPEKARFPALFS